MTAASAPPPARAAGTVELAGTEVARLGFGTMQLAGPGVWGPPADRGEALRILRRAVDLGVDFFDTADAYGPDECELLVAEALHPYRDLVVATKGGLRRHAPGRWSKDGRPEHLRAACEGSLRRLRVDCLELYQLHSVDETVPLEESLGAFAELRQEGKVRRIGVCNVSAAELEQALATVPIVSVQNRLSLADRSSGDVLEACEERGIAFIPWAPLAKGYLARSSGRLRRAAAARGVSPGQLALAWVLGRSRVTVPIPGTSSVEHLEENVAAAEVSLGRDELAALERPSLGYESRVLLRKARRMTGRLRRATLGGSAR